MLRRTAAATALALAFQPLSAAFAAAQDQSVLTYHADNARTGHSVMPGLTWDRARSLRLDSAFSAQLQGHIYAQPLYWRPPGSGHGLLIVATEDDIVYALNAETGQTVWKRTLGAPAPRSALPCGNIDPLGITGTPAIDSASQSVYFDAVTIGSGAPGPQHLIFGLSLRDGSILPGWPVNVASALHARGLTFKPADQSERGAVLIAGGSLYVPYGGHWGDCGEYHGWVVGVSLNGTPQLRAWSTRARAGGIWAPGGVASDGQSLFVSTGNTMGADTWGDGEAIVRLHPDLAPSLEPRDYFAPANWHELDNRDADLGSVAPIALDVRTSGAPSSLIIGMGKDGMAYLASRSSLGGIGGQLASAKVASQPIRTADAAWSASAGAMVVFQGKGADCPTSASDVGVVALEIRGGAPPAIRTAWCAPLHGAGAPIVTTSSEETDPIVWITGAEGDNRLHGFRGDTGAELTTGASGTLEGLHHFGTILAAGRRLYVAGDGRVYAFAY